MPLIGTQSSVYGSIQTSVSVDMSGLEALLDAAPDTAEDIVGWWAQRGAALAKAGIRNVGAIDTGFMVNTTAARRLGAALWSVGTAAFYGVYIEFGTVRMGARPWLMPAIRVAAEGLAGAARAALARVV